MQSEKIIFRENLLSSEKKLSSLSSKLFIFERKYLIFLRVLNFPNGRCLGKGAVGGGGGQGGGGQAGWGMGVAGRGRRPKSRRAFYVHHVSLPSDHSASPDTDYPNKSLISYKIQLL